MGSNLCRLVVCAVAGIRFELVVCLAWSVLQYFPTPLRLGFKGSPAASVQAGLLISPHTHTDVGSNVVHDSRGSQESSF